MMSRILFTSVKRRHACLEQGNWFFHEGQWAVCASAGHCATGEWAIQVYFEKFNKPLPERNLRFESLTHGKDFISKYFELPVIDCRPSKFPKPNSL
jgi:hypothetical protein